MKISYEAIKEQFDFYYMNDQDLLDNNYNREIAEAIATKEAIELSENK